MFERLLEFTSRPSKYRSACCKMRKNLPNLPNSKVYSEDPAGLFDLADVSDQLAKRIVKRQLSDTCRHATVHQLDHFALN